MVPRQTPVRIRPTEEWLPDTELFHAMFGGTVLAWLFIARLDPRELPERLARFVYAALQAGALHAPENRSRQPS